jgi:hypothetical protein
MNSVIALLRRDVLMAAGTSLATSLLEGATAQAQTQTQTPDVVSSAGPAISEFKGKLYAVWRDPGTDSGLWYASFDGSNWSAKARIPKVASSAGPSLAAFGNKLYAAWKGMNTDQRLWYASFDSLKWSPQAQIPDAASSSGPALSVFNRQLLAVWKNLGADVGLSSASFDGSTWSNVSNVPHPQNAPIAPNTRPFSPQAIAHSGLSGAGGVDQGKYSDCVFEASLAAVATTERGQQAISQAIMQNSDGSFNVTFPGAPKRLIKVTQSDLKTTGVHDKATSAEVLEAALIISDPNFANGSHPPPDATGAPDGSRPTPAQYALHLLTGSPASKEEASSSRIGNKIAQALGNGQPVVAFCSNNDQGALASGHEWTVMACDPQANRITLRNPWGHFKTDGTSQGGITYDGNAEVTMNLQLFGQFYKEVTFGYYRA